MSLPAGATTIQLDLPFGRVHGVRFGQAGGHPVLALHGWLDNAASFFPLAPFLDPALDIVAVDLPGHGHSDWLPAGSAYSPLLAVPHVLAIADALGWERYSLLGHSMGAGIAALVAAAAPKRIERMVSLDALGPLAAEPGQAVVQLQRYLRACQITRRTARVVADRDTLIQRRLEHDPQLGERNARLLAERGTRAVDGGWCWSSDPALTLPSPAYLTESQVQEFLQAIVCPVTVILVIPSGRNERLKQLRLPYLSNATLISLPGGHHLHMDEPALLASHLAGLL